MCNLCSEGKIPQIGEEPEEFSFTCGGGDAPTITAEDAFLDGKLKPMFPITCPFEKLPIRPPVKKVFVEIGEASASWDAADGPSCDLSSRQAVAVGVDACKKSNSTGFSKMRRIKDVVERSNSDGRDTFVFLGRKPPSTATVKVEEAERGKPLRKVGRRAPYESYLRSKAKEEERRRTYLPYRIGLIGVFINFNGGLSRNIHPF